eukprot:364448-Chlamydomonas_euryale.AAC.1
MHGSSGEPVVVPWAQNSNQSRGYTSFNDAGDDGVKTKRCSLLSDAQRHGTETGLKNRHIALASIASRAGQQTSTDHTAHDALAPTLPRIMSAWVLHEGHLGSYRSNLRSRGRGFDSCVPHRYSP